MILFFMLIIFCFDYYSFTYGVYLWNKEHNKLGGFAMALLSVIGAVFPVIVLFMKA